MSIRYFCNRPDCGSPMCAGHEEDEVVVRDVTMDSTGYAAILTALNMRLTALAEEQAKSQRVDVDTSYWETQRQEVLHAMAELQLQWVKAEPRLITRPKRIGAPLVEDR